MRLVEERESWRKEFERGETPLLLERYKEFRNGEVPVKTTVIIARLMEDIPVKSKLTKVNNYDRFGCAVEKICEYALWLEDKHGE